MQACAAELARAHTINPTLWGQARITPCTTSILYTQFAKAQLFQEMSDLLQVYSVSIRSMLQKRVGFLNVFCPLGCLGVAPAGQPDIRKFGVKRTLMVQMGGGGEKKQTVWENQTYSSHTQVYRERQYLLVDQTSGNLSSHHNLGPLLSATSSRFKVKSKNFYSSIFLFSRLCFHTKTSCCMNQIMYSQLPYPN